MNDYRFLNVVATSGGRASLMLYGQIGDEKDGVDPERVAAELIYLEQDFPQIDVHINSQGGEVFAGIAIYNALRASKADIRIYVDGLAASIAGIIALCGKPMYMSRFSRLMLHQVSGSCSGGVEDMRKCADLIAGLEVSLSEIVAEKCGQTAEAVRAEYFDGKDHWLTADEAVARRLCNGIFDVKGAESLGAAPTAEAIYAFANKLQLKQPSNTNRMDFINELKKVSTFENLNEEQSLVQIRTLANDAAKVPALEAQVEMLKKQLQAANERETDAYLNQAVAAGKIASDQVASYKALMSADAENTRKIIDAMPEQKKAVSINDLLASAKGVTAPAGAQDLANMSWDEIDKAGRLAELKNNFPELYARKFQEAFGNSQK